MYVERCAVYNSNFHSVIKSHLKLNTVRITELFSITLCICCFALPRALLLITLHVLSALRFTKIETPRSKEFVEITNSVATTQNRGAPLLPTQFS
jgi:hypothetical protein